MAAFTLSRAIGNLKAYQRAAITLRTFSYFGQPLTLLGRDGAVQRSCQFITKIRLLTLKCQSTLGGGLNCLTDSQCGWMDVRKAHSDSGASNGLTPGDLKQRIDKLTEQFAEAREMLEDIRAVKKTVYYEEDLEEATTAVDETLESYRQLLDDLSSDQREDVLRTIGLRMEELKAHKKMIQDEKDEH